MLARKTGLGSGHPRACGEDTLASSWPPSARRAIPARAGRTRNNLTWLRKQGGPSPRVRGGRKPDGKRRLQVVGPSPRVRGGRGLPASIGSTHAGHPRACGEDDSMMKDPWVARPGHPRACGEDSP